MDISFLTQRLAVGEGIWTSERMGHLVRLGFTHIISVQAEFDERDLARDWGLEVLWNPVDDDFQPKPPDFFARSVEFAKTALARQENQLYVHCAAGIHRGPLTCAAILLAWGYSVEDALELIRRRRPAADFPAVYVASLRRFGGVDESDSPPVQGSGNAGPVP